MAALRFVLNGQPRTVDGIPPTTTVLDWLRGGARLTGTKEGCAEGDCGACTIAISRDGSAYQAVNSCLMMLPQLDGTDILTVEGLQDGANLHPVQKAMIEADATQCGFCTPGFAIALFALGQENAAPADDDIHEALAGNLCRCTGYRAIVDAAHRAAAAGLAAKTMPTSQAAHDTLAYRVGGQDFVTPRDLPALFDALDKHPKALILAGGTDLGLRVSKHRETFPAVISTGAVEELKWVAESDDGGIEIGGAATYTDALPYLDKAYPSFASMIRRIGSRQIRNLGTIAGNIANASPIGDTIPCLIALNASVQLLSRGGIHDIPVEAFITGYRKTALKPGEIIAAIRIPPLKVGEDLAVYKVSKRFDQDISTVIAAFVVTRRGDIVTGLRAAYGGMAERAKRATHLEAALAGRPWTAEALGDVDMLVAQDFTPMSDQRGSAAYRLRVAANLVRRLQIESTEAGALARVDQL